MEANEIMTNEEVIETATEEIVKAGSGKGFRVVAGIGIGVLAGILIYKYITKTIEVKNNVKKELAKINDETVIETVIVEDDISKSSSENIES